GKDSPGEIIFVAVESDAQICAHHGEKMLYSATEAKLGIGRLPIHFRRAAALEIPQNDKAVTHAADPSATSADVHVAEKVVGGIGDESSVFGVGAGEGHCRGSVFEDAVV